MGRVGWLAGRPARASPGVTLARPARPHGRPWARLRTGGAGRMPVAYTREKGASHPQGRGGDMIMIPAQDTPLPGAPGFVREVLNPAGGLLLAGAAAAAAMAAPASPAPLALDPPAGLPECSSFEPDQVRAAAAACAAGKGACAATRAARRAGAARPRAPQRMNRAAARAAAPRRGAARASGALTPHAHISLLPTHPPLPGRRLLHGGRGRPRLRRVLILPRLLQLLARAPRLPPAARRPAGDGLPGGGSVAVPGGGDRR
jgi:hypothetical protein